jgi:hypothetical protein
VRDLVDPGIGCPVLGAPSCSDGIDNDDDGLIDYPDDPFCCTPNDVSEGYVFSLWRRPYVLATARIAQNSLAHVIEANPQDSVAAGIAILEYLHCEDPIPPEVEEPIEPICLEWAIDTGMPQICPGLDCHIDQPGCMDPYQYRRAFVPYIAIQSYAQWVEGLISDKELESRLVSMIETGELRIEEKPPERTRYRSTVSVVNQVLIAAAVLVVGLVSGFAIGRERKKHAQDI